MYRLTAFCLLALLCSCTPQPVDYSKFVIDAPSTSFQDTTLEFNYLFDPYILYAQETQQTFVDIKPDMITIEGKVEAGVDVIIIKYKVISVDSVVYNEQNTKVRYILEQFNVPYLVKRNECIEIYNNSILVFDGNRVLCNKSNVGKVEDLIKNGILTDRNPYIYTISSMQTLKEIADKFKTTEKNIKTWNPHILNGYTSGVQIAIHWFLPQEYF